MRRNDGLQKLHCFTKSKQYMGKGGTVPLPAILTRWMEVEPRFKYRWKAID